MTRNVGGIDRGIRIVIGVAALVAGFFFFESTAWQLVAIVIGVAALLTAIFGFCTFNRLLGINTRRQRIDQPKEDPHA
jgi:hypothetical protein